MGRGIGYLEEGLVAFLMAAMTIVTFMQVVARYVFNYSFVWALELTGVTFAWLIFAGMFMEPTGIVLILAPILFPIAMQLGIDPVHLGIIMVVNLEIGMITPPVGLNLFVTAGITKMSIGQVVRASLPWTMVLLLFLVIVTYVPAMTLFLPSLMD